MNEETKEKYVAFVKFLHKLHGFTTKVNEVDQCINLSSQTLNKFKKTDGNASPAPAAEPPAQDEPGDDEPDDSDGDSATGADAAPQGEEPPEDDDEEPEEQEQQPVLDGNLTFMPENNSVVPQNIGSPTQLANVIQQLHQVAILSPKTYAETKQSVMQLPLEARKAIQRLCGGLPLVYGGLDGGQPVFMSGTTTLQANSLYNQVAHQLSGWYMLIPKSGGKPDILFQLVKGKHKAIFQLTGYNEEVIKKMFTQSGNVWVGKFYTEQNTLKKTGNRIMVWSSDPAKFGSPAVSAATSSGGQPVPAQKGTKPGVAPVD